MKQLRPFAPQTPHAVGRDVELQAIKNALTDNSGKSAFLYFIGPGGIGKTRLIEEAREQALDSVRVSPVIDLYHAETHSVAGLERLLVEGLDSEAQHFAAYRQQSADLEKRRLGGVRITLEEQAALTQTFVQDYAVLAAQQRSCLRFDTTELIQRESDRVQKLCQLETSYLEIRDWLLQVLLQLPNTVVVLAGRPPAPLREDLQALAEQQDALSFEAFELEGLSPAACHAYLEALQEQEPRLRDIPDEVWELAWKYTAGHPIRLSLVIDLVLNGREIARIFPVAHAPQVESLSVSDIDRYLIEELTTIPADDYIVLRYLVLARKGLDAVLLHHLEPAWSLEDCQARLDAMQRFTFVKRHPGTAQFFIHDEVYALFDRYVLQERHEYASAYRCIHAYYAQRLEAQPDEVALLKPDLLYYALQVDPWEGFWRTYLPWAEEAVRAGDSALDMRLRDALLHFRHDTAADPWVEYRLPTDLLERDAAVRWCRRYLTQGQHEQTLKIAQRIAERGLLVGQPLYSAALSIVHAEAVLYTATEDEKEAARELEATIAKLEAWSVEDDADPRIWWRTCLLGKAHNILGYYFRLQGQKRKAIAEYKRAIWAFRQTRSEDEMTAALTNLGFIYVQLGLAVEAETTLQDALGLRKEGPKLPWAYTLNTLGLAYTYDNRPSRGARFCEMALKDFENLGHLRGQGLAHLALGLAYRMCGEEWKDDLATFEDAEKFFAKASSHLEKARHIFEEGISEPIRLWEAYNELGSLHCDWAYLLSKHQRNGAAREKYRQAIAYLNQSIRVSCKNGLEIQLADSYDDLSQVYADMGDHKTCDDYVARVLDIVPVDYHLTPEGFKDTAELVVEEWWLLLGKMHLGKAVRKIKRAVDLADEIVLEPDEKDSLLVQAAEEYAHAVAYFQKYSPYSVHLGRTLKSIQQRIKTLKAERVELTYTTIRCFSESHRVDLGRLLLLIENTLGLEQ